MSIINGAHLTHPKTLRQRGFTKHLRSRRNWVSLTVPKGCHSDRRTGQLSAKGDLGGHGLRAKTLKAAPLTLPSLALSSPNPPTKKRIKAANEHTINEEFSTESALVLN